jgi:pimeloyl-ACP methyl ester carboxylesterase
MADENGGRPGARASRRAMIGALGAGLSAMAASSRPAAAQPATNPSGKPSIPLAQPPPQLPLPPSGPWTGGGVVRRSGGQISYVTLGDEKGLPLVLLSKLGGTVADWRKTAPLFAAKGYRVIAVDLPGHGGSTILGAPPHIQTVPETAAEIKAALDEIGVTRFVLGGNSIGGIVGIVMAAFWPEAVSKLVLVSVSMIPAMTRAQVDALDASVRANFGPNWEPLPRPPEDVAMVGFNDQTVLQEDNESRARTGIWLRPAERGVAVVGVTDYMPRVQCPTFVLLADHGRYVKYGATAKALMKTVEVQYISNSGSFIHMERPVEAAAAINAFLAKT